MRASAGVGLSCRANAQRRQTEPAVEWRLMDFNGLDFTDRHDVRRTPRPPMSRAKITLAQRVTQVPVFRDADQVDQRQQAEWPQGEGLLINAVEKRGGERANRRAFDHGSPDRKPRNAPPFDPFNMTGVEIWKEGCEERVNLIPARYWQQNITARIVVLVFPMAARCVGAQCR